MSRKGSENKQPWLVPILVAIIGAISTITVALISQSQSSASLTTVSAPSPTATPALSYRNWAGAWDMQWEYEGKWDGASMNLHADPLGINGTYENETHKIGILSGTFVDDRFTKVTGIYTNTAGTGVTCASGSQEGAFTFTLTNEGRHIDGLWDLCGKGTRRQWKADKRD
jgi:hypothetical protein